jgi:hypothetical protein
MSLLTALARVLAAETGRAQPIRTVRHVHLSARPLVFVPLQLATRFTSASPRSSPTAGRPTSR